MNHIGEFDSTSTASLNQFTTFLSVIVPIHNEEESIRILCEKLLGVLDHMGTTFEIICVNDGSSDGSLTALRKVAAERKELKVVSFRRNFGQTAAMMAGIDHAQGEIIVSIDADCRTTPGDIPMPLSKMLEGGLLARMGFDHASGRVGLAHR